MRFAVELMALPAFGLAGGLPSLSPLPPLQLSLVACAESVRAELPLRGRLHHAHGGGVTNENFHNYAALRRDD